MATQGRQEAALCGCASLETQCPHSATTQIKLKQRYSLLEQCVGVTLALRELAGIPEELIHEHQLFPLFT